LGGGGELNIELSDHFGQGVAIFYNLSIILVGFFPSMKIFIENT